MTKFFLRASRWVVALIVSIHVAILRLHIGGHAKTVAAKEKQVGQAQFMVQVAQSAVRSARDHVREVKDAHIVAANDHRNARIAADAEAKFYGREL